MTICDREEEEEKVYKERGESKEGAVYGQGKKEEREAGKGKQTYQEAPTVECEKQCICSCLYTIICPSP